MIQKLGVFKDYSDNSLKTVFVKNDNKIIEMTLLFNKEEMDVVCVPTHHFCNLGCKMCHLTNKGLNKQMIPIMIDDFIYALKETVNKNINGNLERRTDKKKLLISFMGVGEPLLNLNLIKDVYQNEHLLKQTLGYDKIGYAISTMMPNNNLLKLTQMVDDLNIPLKVHFSLHTPIDKDRLELIPSTKVTIKEALEYLQFYRNTLQKNEKFLEKYVQFHRTNDPIEIHYTLIKNVNDGELELNEVCNLLYKYRIPIKFIRFNPTNTLEKSEKEEEWINTISKKVPNLRIKTYSPPGREIGSSCGEFTKHYYHEKIETEKEKIEFNEWKKKHEIFE